MTKHDLKEMMNLGAELGAAKAENDRLREALRWYEEKVADCRKIGSLGDNARQALDRDGGFRARDALSQQPEPTDTYTAVDMATAAAQGFRDGQAAVEPVPVQDELDPIEKAALDARLRRDFEARWPVPKGVIWGAAVGDYCLSEFAQGIALSYPDMWMAYKAGSERGKA